MDPRRARIVFTAVLLALFIPVVVVLALQGGDGDKPAQGLRLEIDPNQDVVVAYVETPELPAVAGSTVSLECRDRAGNVLGRSRQFWPFKDTDGGTAAPHVHANMPRAAKIATCTVLGTDPPLGGAVGVAR